jgi:hypothetical protein
MGKRLENDIATYSKDKIEKSQKSGEDYRRNNHHSCGRSNFLPAGPHNFSEFSIAIAKELKKPLHPLLLTIINEKQARQDSNLQHPVLETGALAIGATGLCTN